MKKYQVLRKIGTCSASVVREFDVMDDACLFISLLTRSEVNKSTTYYMVAVIAI